MEYLGYDQSLYPVRRDKYGDVAKSYNTSELTHDHETQMYENGEQAIVILTDFPESTDPFWNMKRNDDWTAKKVDIILSGQETFGSAERETDTNVMWDRFHSICNGAYKEKINFTIWRRTYNERNRGLFKIGFLSKKWWWNWNDKTY